MNLEQLQTHHATISMKWQFLGEIRTFTDLLYHYYADSVPPPWTAHYPARVLQSKVTRSVLDEFLSDRYIEYTTAQWLINNPPIIERYETQTSGTTESSQVPQKDDSLGKALSFPKYTNLNDRCNDASKSTRPSENPRETDTVAQVLHEQVSVRGKSDKEKDKDYGIHNVKGEEKISFLWFQKKAGRETLDLFDPADIEKQVHSLLISAGTGVGKTIMAGIVFRRLIDSNFKERMGNMSPYPYMYVTKAPVVEQVEEDLKLFFNLTEDDVLVTNYDQFRSKFGELFLREKLVIKGGEEEYQVQWREIVQPLLIVLDESHSLKNERSKQSRIFQKFNDIPKTWKTFQLHTSATPGAKVSDFKVFAVGTRAMFQGRELTNELWPMFAQSMCDGLYVRDKANNLVPAQPQDYCPAAVKRLKNYLSKYIVTVKGVRPQFKAHNRVVLREFQNDSERTSYLRALDEMNEQLNKLYHRADKQQMSAGQVHLQEITILLYFRMKAEMIHAPYICKRMWQAVNGTDPEHIGKLFAAIACVNFKQTITYMTKIFYEDYNIPRSKICLIWGGGQSATAKKQAQKKKMLDSLSDPLVLAQMEKDGINIEELLQFCALDLVEAKAEEEVDAHLKLGVQSKKQREEEKLRFNDGRALYCLFTYKAGGTGLSLPHTDRYTKQKVRHKESGYAVEEDIANIPTRPRRTFGTPTWSPFEIVQGFGRAPRIISLSDTYQDFFYLKNTVEERVADRASMALTCVSTFIGQGEHSWENLILGKELVLQKMHESDGEQEDVVEDMGYFDEENNQDNNESDKQ